MLTSRYGDIVVYIRMPESPVSLNGGGSTFVYPQMQAWISRFRNISESLVSINYQGIGSGAGEAQWFSRVLDFGAADVPISNSTYSKLASAGAGFIQFPIIAGSVVIIYNLPGWDGSVCGSLRLSGEVLASIYLGSIIYWDDPRVRDLQVDICRSKLPHEPIRAIHRSDGSGTTALFTLYLSHVSSEWSRRVGYGYTVEWPRDALGYGEGARGNDGVAAKVKGTAYSIGYVEYSYAVANKLSFAALKNRDGYFVLPSPQSVSEALRRGAQDLPEPSQYWGDVPRSFIDKEGRDTYPIVGLVYVFIYTDLPRDKAIALSAFFRWILTEGQRQDNLVEGYLPLPPELAKQAIGYIEKALKYR